MSFDNKYLYFYVVNHTGVHSTSGYTLGCTPFTFIPVLDTGDDTVVSNTRLMWDFGDGTTSRDITATHQYSIPGTYNATCYLYSTGGQGYESSFTQSIFVRDYISDTLALSADRVTVIEAGHYQSPFTIYRFNSWQTYPTLGVDGSTIMLHASGTGAPLLDQEAYASDKYAHLKPHARFLAFEPNLALGTQDLVPVDNIKTTNNTEIYVKIDNGNIIQCLSSDLGATLAGTSGRRVVYFVDDLVKVPPGSLLPDAVLTLAYFDSTEFYDNDSYNKNLPALEYPVLHQIVTCSYTPVYIHQIHIDRLSVTSNGLDTEGVSAVNANFNIAPNKFVGQKIPFVVKVKDNANFTVKTIPNLTAIPSNQSWSPYTVKVKLLRSIDGSEINQGITFKSDFGLLSSLTTGGFFKGYLSANTSYEGVKIQADAYITGDDYYVLPTAYACIGHPQSKSIHVIDIQQPYNNIHLNFTDNTTSTKMLTGVFSTGVIPSRSSTTGGVDYDLWVVDGDMDQAVLYDTLCNPLLSCTLPSGSSPSNIVVDGDENVWISLHDAVSTVKISRSTGNIVAYAVPPFDNVNYNDPVYYLALSGHAGSNSILPATVDVDTLNNLWVSYNFALSGMVCKYDTNGTLLSTFLTAPYVPGEVIVSPGNHAWAIYKQIDAVIPVSGQDGIVLLDGTTPQFYPAGKSLWNVTFDAYGDLWMTAGLNDVVHFNTDTHVYTTYALPSAFDDLGMCNLGGIACTTSNTILVLSEPNRCIFYFNVDDASNGAISALSVTHLSTPNDIDNESTQDMLNAYGDWTGFRHINRFYKNNITGYLSGQSTTFNIYPSGGKYSIAKINENFNPAAQYNSYVFQESLQDYTKLFTDFFGAAVGKSSDAPGTLGKKIYEKIANFCSNIADVDTCNIAALKSLHQEMSQSFITLQQNNFNYPANVSRLIDLFSIKLSKLRGSRNKFSENFDSKGFNYLAHSDPSVTTSVKYGKNKGTELNINTTILHGASDNYIVAYEKFSEQYSLINTNIAHTSYISYIDPVNQTYPLSSYDARWGWGLVLPDDYHSSDLSKYYIFYEYVPGYDNSQIEGIINWSDKNTTIPESIDNMQQWNDIMESMLTYTLAEGMEILSATK